jgi:mannose-6-phosphate isomerase
MSDTLDEPLVFEPILKRILWGGRRLGTHLGKRLGPESDYAESWEIADHANGRSVVAWPSRWAGTTLADLVAKHPQALLGRTPGTGETAQFPLLIKFLDAHQVLSLQVHPNDLLARELVNDNGKNEAWVVMHAEPGSRIFAGLKPGTTRERFAKAMAAGTVADVVHAFEPRPGDCIMIPAGTVHAIGSGIVLAEIQQMSDATFRVDDWGRVGPDGKPRQLHQAEALAATDFARGPVGPVEPVPVSTGDPAVKHEKLVQCDYFTIDRWRLRNETQLGDPQKKRFSILIVMEGQAAIRDSHGNELSADRGTTVLLPAAAGAVAVRPGSESTLEILDCFTP